MRRTALLTSLLACCIATYAFADDPTSNVQPNVVKSIGGPPPAAILVGGDTFASATVIPGLPYADAGTTAGFANDVTLSCATNTAPDVFYRITPAQGVCINISLCGSGYDTMLGVFNSAFVELNCNDDSGCASSGLHSQINGVSLTGGQTYYIGIDGFGSNSGQYSLNVTECPPPPVCDPCPPLAIAEGEPPCGPNYVDTYNAGCNSTPVSVMTVPCNTTICGKYGTFAGPAGGMRDTDWYQLTLGVASPINTSVEGFGASGTALAILDTACPPTVICGQFAAQGQCVTVTCNSPGVLPPGNYRVFTASFFDNTPCETSYVLSITGCSTEAKTASWGTLKTLYR